MLIQKKITPIHFFSERDPVASYVISILLLKTPAPPGMQRKTL